MKIYKSDTFKYFISLCLVFSISLYYLLEFSNNSIEKPKPSRINPKKSLEWFIEDFTLTNYDKNGALSHKLVAENAFKYQENTFIKLKKPFLKHFPTKEYNKIYNVSGDTGLVCNKTTHNKNATSKKKISNSDVEFINFDGQVIARTPEFIAKSQSLSYNLENQSMQFSKNVETIYSKKS